MTNSTPILQASDLEDSHPMLPDGWSRPMSAILRDGGPWACGVCGGPSYLSYRCSKCGKDLAGNGSTSGQRRLTQ